MNSNTNYLGGWVWFLSNFGLQGVLSIKIGGLTQKIQVNFLFIKIQVKFILFYFLNNMTNMLLSKIDVFF